MFGWLTFYHQGHEVAKDFKPYMTELQLKIQKVSLSSFILFAFNCKNIIDLKDKSIIIPKMIMDVYLKRDNGVGLVLTIYQSNEYICWQFLTVILQFVFFIE